MDDERYINIDDEQCINIEDGLSVERSIEKIELSVGAVKIVDKYEIFTEEEIYNINGKVPELDERVGVIEDEIEEINSSLEDITSDLEVKADKSYVDSAIESVDVSSQLTNYATKSDLEVKADKSYVDSAIESVDVSSQLTNYATKSELSLKVDKVTGKSLISDSEIERLSTLKNYDDTEIKNSLNSKADKTDLHSHNNKSVLDGITSTKITEWNNKSTFDGNYNTLTNKPTIPTKTSDLINDSGFITSIPSEYVTDSELNTKADITTVSSHTSDTTAHITSAERTTWNNKANASDITSLSNRISSIESTADVSIPSYVFTEVNRVSDLAYEKIGSNCFVGAIFTDIHYETSGSETDIAIKRVGQAIKEIRKVLPLDFVANLGDNCESEPSHKIINKYLYDATLGINSFWLRGNHDGSAYNYSDTSEYSYLTSDSEVYKYVGAKNKGHIIDCDNRKSMYGYKDFDDVRLRIIYLNTSEVFDDNISASNPNVVMSTTQVNWLNNKALNFTDKDDVTKWRVLVLSHAPLDWNTSTQQAVTVLNNYASISGGAKIIGTVHGHVHNCNLGTIGSNKIPRIAIPQVCASRYNEYSSSGTSYQTWGDFKEGTTTPIYYYKTANTSADTTFCILVIDFENNKHYIINYGTNVSSTSDKAYTKVVNYRIINFNGTIEKEGDVTSYTVTNTLTNVTTNNNTVTVEKGESYNAILTANSGYMLSTVNVTMGGTDITSSAYSNGVITIASVTGAIVITATAISSAPTIDNKIRSSTNLDGTQYVGHNGEDGYSIGYRVNSSGVEVEQSGMCCTGFIRYEEEVIRLKNITVAGTKSPYIVTYYQDGTYWQVKDLTTVLQDDGTGVYTGSYTGSGYFRITCGVIDDTTILTLNEEIV